MWGVNFHLIVFVFVAACSTFVSSLVNCNKCVATRKCTTCSTGYVLDSVSNDCNGKCQCGLVWSFSALITYFKTYTYMTKMTMVLVFGKIYNTGHCIVTFNAKFQPVPVDIGVI